MVAALHAIHDDRNNHWYGQPSGGYGVEYMGTDVKLRGKRVSSHNNMEAIRNEARSEFLTEQNETVIRRERTRELLQRERGARLVVPQILPHQADVPCDRITNR